MFRVNVTFFALQYTLHIKTSFEKLKTFEKKTKTKLIKKKKSRQEGCSILWMLYLSPIG